MFEAENEKTLDIEAQVEVAKACVRLLEEGHNVDDAVRMGIKVGETVQDKSGRTSKIDTLARPDMPHTLRDVDFDYKVNINVPEHFLDKQLILEIDLPGERPTSRPILQRSAVPSARDSAPSVYWQMSLRG